MATTFLTCTLQGMVDRDTNMKIFDLSAEEARTLLATGVVGGPEFFDTEEESRGHYFRVSVAQKLTIDEPTLDRNIRPWREGTKPEIGDQAIYAMLDKLTGKITLKRIHFIPPNELVRRLRAQQEGT